MRSKKIITPDSVRVDELLSVIGDDYLESLCKELQADKWVIKLETVMMFKLILCSILDNERLSLRMLADQFTNVPFQLLEQSILGQKTAHSSIRDRLKQINVLFFERVYERVHSLLGSAYSQKELSGVYNLKRYDSTMISVFSHMLEGMQVGNTSKKKNQVKLTTELIGDFEVRMRFFKDQDYLGEEVALREMIQSQTHDSQSLIVFDRGLKSRQTFCELNDLKTQFVTRLNENTRYKFIRQHAPVPTQSIGGLRFIQDSIVHLYGDGRKLVQEDFRMIEAVVEKNNKKIFFLTNISSLDMQTIAEVYRRRWDIEVFFRFVKQEMNLTHFVCNDTNAIQVMLYSTLIAAMLVLIYKKKNGIRSYKIAKTKFFKELQAEILLKLIESEGGIEQLKKTLRLHLNRAP